MIGYLKGKIIDQDSNSVLVEVQGVGYRVVQSSKFKVENSNEIELWIHTHVREDEISLYGFGDKKTLKLFELLLSVNGVGPKVGMAIVSASSSEKISEAIARADVGFFTAIKGVGKKGAQKIIIDLKNKMGSVAELDLSSDGGDDVVEALVSMGYNREKVISVVRGLDDNLSESQKIKEALKKISNF